MLSRVKVSISDFTVTVPWEIIRVSKFYTFFILGLALELLLYLRQLGVILLRLIFLRLAAFVCHQTLGQENIADLHQCAQAAFVGLILLVLRC